MSKFFAFLFAVVAVVVILFSVYSFIAFSASLAMHNPDSINTVNQAIDFWTFLKSGF